MDRIFVLASGLFRQIFRGLAILALLLVSTGGAPRFDVQADPLRTFSGHVYLGSPPTTGTPAAGVTIRLYGSDYITPVNFPLNLLATTVTDQTGMFTLEYDASPSPYSNLQIIEVDSPGTASIIAQAPSPATVTGKSSISYDATSTGAFTGLDFWDQPGCSEQLINGGFATGSLPPWQQTGGVQLISSGGGFAAVFNGSNPTQELSQVFTVPTGTNPGQLSFSWLAQSATPQSRDYVDVYIYSPVGDHHRHLTALVPGMSWQQELIDIKPYAGIQVTLTLRMTTSSGQPPTFQFDDFSALTCVPPPPAITVPPTATSINTTSAVISWTTDQPASSLVEYGRLAQTYDSQTAGTDSVTQHSVTLSNLQSASTYHYHVVSVASSGQVSSNDLNFETLPPTESNLPGIVLSVLRTGETFIGTATVSDPVGIDRVEFYLDGARVQTDYAPPYTLTIDPALYADIDYTLQAVAYNVGGKSNRVETGVHLARLSDHQAPTVKINGVTINGKTAIVQASLSDNWTVTSATLQLDGITRQSVNVTPPQKSVVVNLNLDLETVAMGAHTLTVMAADQSGNHGYDQTPWTAPPLGPGVQPSLVLVSHQAILSQGRLNVYLTVRNVGATAAKDVVIVDSTGGFLAVPNPSGAAPCTPRYLEPLNLAEAILKPSNPIPAGTDRIYSYEVVPLLTDPAKTPSLGAATTLSYNSMTDDEHSDFVLQEITQVQSMGTESVPQAHAEMTGSRSYLIVTSPHNLEHFYPDGDVQTLLGSLAQLTRDRNGVLGFFSGAPSFVTGVSKDDGLAVGYVEGGSTAQVVIGDRTNGEIRTYTMDGTLLAHFWTNYTPGNRLGVGKVMGAAQGDMIVVADEVSWGVRIYEADGSYMSSIPVGFHADDGLAVGDVLGLGYDQVVVADASTNQIRVYNGGGSLLATLNRALKPRDGLAAADVNGDGQAEIILASQLDQGIYIYSYSQSGWAVSHFARSIWPWTTLAAGDVGWDKRAEILVYDGLFLNIYDSSGLLRQTNLVPGSEYDRIASGHVVDTPNAFNDSYNQILVASQTSGRITSFEPQKAVGTGYQLLGFLVPGGAWSQKLNPSFTSSGSLLLVGETNIVPAFGGYTFGKQYTSEGWETLKADVTDFPYADMVGNDTIPELRVGRIVGDSAKALLQPVLTSIGAAENQPGFIYKRSDALAASGHSTSSGGTIDFQATANVMGQTLTSQGTTVWHVHTPDINPPSNIVPDLLADFNNKDIIILAGHGNYNVWDAMSSYDLLGGKTPFGIAHPVVMTASCLTGRYPNGASLAEAFLQQGAGAYIGMTESGICSNDGCHTEEPFFQYWLPGETIGQGFKDWKVSLDNSNIKNFLRAIYHLFGDPLYGTLPIIPGSVAQSERANWTSSTNSLNLTVPDYSIAQVDGHQMVSIPQGDMLTEVGYPQVPEFQITYDLPAGERVQNVTLTSRSAGMDIPGLDLPSVVLQMPGEQLVPSTHPASAPASSSEWWPDQAYRWSVVQTSSGDRLTILVYPFQYSVVRATGRFYKNYSFAIDTTPSTVDILHAGTLQTVYPPNVPITAGGEITSTQPIPDLVAVMTVSALDGNPVSGGFPVISLHQVNGRAAFQAQLTGQTLAAGDYTINTEIRDGTGKVLARSSAPFRIGVHELQIDQITASSEVFNPGDPVQLTVTVSNSGTQNSSGTIFFTVLDAGGNTVYESIQPVPDLSQPGDAYKATAVWNTPPAGPSGAGYHVMASVQYEGSLAGPADLFIQSRGTHLYLPLTHR